MVTKTDIEYSIINWVKKRNPNVEVNNKSDLHTDGLIDSFGVFELVHELEKRFSFQFTDDDFQHPHFRTVNGIAQLIISREKSN